MNQLVHLLSNMTTPTSRKGRKIAIAFIFAFAVIFNLDHSIEDTQRFLTGEGEKVVVDFDPKDFHDEELGEGEEMPFISRLLSKNLGGGKCEWTAPDALERWEQDNTTTLVASYPGSGKRLTWRILEALTGSRTGDDWDLSENGYHVLTLKTSYPHFEGPWAWGDEMDQMIMLIRNPLHAIPSYHTMRYELWFSTSWDQSYARRNFTYTERPTVEEWEPWRDARFKNEINRWGNFTDFWMMGGMKWNNTFIDGNGDDVPYHTNWTYNQDFRCHNRTTIDGRNLTRLMDCNPKTIIQFEKLYSPKEDIGLKEMAKLAAVLDGVENVDIIELEARPCVYKEVMRRTEFYNPNRNGKGPAPDTKKFTAEQIEMIIAKMVELRYKYSREEWQYDSNALVLVPILDSYITLAKLQFQIAIAEACADDESWYFNDDPGFTCAIVQKDMCHPISQMFPNGPNGLTANTACCICGGGIYPQLNLDLLDM